MLCRASPVALQGFLGSFKGTFPDPLTISFRPKVISFLNDGDNFCESWEAWYVSKCLLRWLLCCD